MHIHEAFHFFLISKNYHVSLCMWIAYLLYAQIILSFLWIFVHYTQL